MTDISEAAKLKAQELMTAANGGTVRFWSKMCFADVALARFIQEVSDAAKEVVDVAQALGAAPDHLSWVQSTLARFILSEPVDPLVEVLADLTTQYTAGPVTTVEQDAARLRKTLAKHRLKIVEI